MFAFQITARNHELASIFFHFGVPVDIKLSKLSISSWVVYMSSSFWLLSFGSRDLSQAEKELTACKDEQMHRIFTQNDNQGPL